MEADPRASPGRCPAQGRAGAPSWRLRPVWRALSATSRTRVPHPRLACPVHDCSAWPSRGFGSWWPTTKRRCASMLKEYLGCCGWDVDAAQSATEAERFLETRTYAAVITDLRFSGPSGTEGLGIVRAARTHNPERPGRRDDGLRLARRRGRGAPTGRRRLRAQAGAPLGAGPPRPGLGFLLARAATTKSGASWRALALRAGTSVASRVFHSASSASSSAFSTAWTSRMPWVGRPSPSAAAE